MKKTYQISHRRAAEKFRKFALASPTPIQLTFPLPEIAELDLNPVMALAPGLGCRIVDARVRVKAIARPRRGRDL